MSNAARGKSVDGSERSGGTLAVIITIMNRSTPLLRPASTTVQYYVVLGLFACRDARKPFAGSDRLVSHHWGALSFFLKPSNAAIDSTYGTRASQMSITRIDRAR